ncbi:MAG: hypothetical protein WC551_07315 [Patescibacteria group bacterium]
MPESSQFAKQAACLAMTAKVVDEEIARILLALNDTGFVCRLFADAAVQDKTITPGAWRTLSNALPRETLAAHLHDAFISALRNRSDRGAKNTGYLLAKLKLDKEEVDTMITAALDHDNLHMAAWLMRRPAILVNRLTIYRWLKKNSKRATDLSCEIERQLEAAKDHGGRRQFLEHLAEDVSCVIKDNEALRQAISRGEPDEIADALYGCLLVTDESREAMEQFAWDNPERIPHLAELMQKDAKEVVEDGATPAMGNFFRAFAQELIKRAEAAKTAARLGG